MGLRFKKRGFRKFFPHRQHGTGLLTQPRPRPVNSLQCTISPCWIENPMAGPGRVRMWRGGLRFSLSVAAPFGWRCLNSRTITPFPHPPHRTGHADFPHPALGQDSCLCTRKVMRSSPAPQHRAVLPRRAPTERSAHNRQCHRLGGHSLPGSQSGFFLRFSVWRLPQLPHITGVS